MAFKRLLHKIIYIQRTVSTIAAENEITYRVIDRAGIITLSRPKKHNTLTLQMMKQIRTKLLQWDGNKDVVIVKGCTPKVFCGGGDIKSAAESTLKGHPSLAQSMVRDEYRMLYTISQMKTPYIALMSGVAMGGGGGLAVNGRYRVATELTIFAMPETRVGFFPDAGGSHFLPRAVGYLGLYLGLTASQLRGYDVVHGGLATHFCESNSLGELEDRLTKCINDEEIKRVLKDYEPISKPPFTLAPHQKTIDRIFSLGSVEVILEALKRENSQWAQETIKSILKRSPVALKLTFELYKRGIGSTLLECLNREYDAAFSRIVSDDFNEGVRALLIDRDGKPQWNPKTLNEVNDCVLQEYFQGKLKI